MRNKIFIGFIVINSFILGEGNLKYDIKIKEKNTLVIGVVKGEESSSRRYYVIKGKESLEEIANSYRTSVEDLIRINKLKNRRDIKPGQILYFEETRKQNEVGERDS